MRFETELIPILPQNLPSVRGLQDFSALALGQDEVYVVPDPEMPADQRAEWLAKIQPALAQVPNVARVEFPSEELVKNAGVFAAWLLVNAPTNAFQRAQAALGADEAARRLADIPEKLAGAVDPIELETLRFDPLGLREVLGSGSTDAPGFAMPQPSFLVVSPVRPLTDTAADTAFVDALKTRLRQILPREMQDRVLLTGSPVINA